MKSSPLRSNTSPATNSTMTEPLYHSESYREFLQAQFSGRHGLKSKVAEAVGCHSAYLSQVLKGSANFSMEQAYRLAEFFGFKERELDFWITLVEKDRAGSHALKKYFQNKLDLLKRERHELQNRIPKKQQLDPERKATYFGTWYYSVTHLLLLTLPGFQSPQKIANALNLSEGTIREVIQFLEESGLVQRENESFKMGAVDLHLGSDTLLVNSHHSNWRHHAIRSLDQKRLSDFHYSSVVTISEASAEKIRELILKSVEEVRAEVAQSKDLKQVQVFTLDWFQLV